MEAWSSGAGQRHLCGRAALRETEKIWAAVTTERNSAPNKPQNPILVLARRIRVQDLPSVPPCLREKLPQPKPRAARQVCKTPVR